MDERLQFVARRLASEPVAELCREFGIFRKNGYKIFDRYQQCGVQGLTIGVGLTATPINFLFRQRTMSRGQARETGALLIAASIVAAIRERLPFRDW